MPAGGHARLGHDAHQADVAAPINQLKTALRDQRAKFGGRGGVLGTRTDAGCTIDTDSFHAGDFMMV